MPVLDASPSESIAGIAAFENGPRRRTTLLMSPARACRSVSTGVVSSESDPSRSIVGLSSSRKRGSVWMSSSSARALLRGRLGHLAGVADRARHPRAVARQRREHGVGVDRQLLELRVLAGEDLEHLVGLAQRRVRAPDHLVEVLAAPRQAGAELVEDQRQPLALGLAHRVADQVDVDRLRGVGDRQQVLALARAVVDASRASAARPRWPSAAASACTRRSARRSGSAGARCSSRRGGSPGSRAR